MNHAGKERNHPAQGLAGLVDGMILRPAIAALRVFDDLQQALG